MKKNYLKKYSNKLKNINKQKIYDRETLDYIIKTHLSLLEKTFY